ncbi:hypothetical protein [Lysobacter sp. CA199]|uniref:hypothetical protein n=1 Tax=Lysobacter sp. CA199 TaxID=3455608 RepID=UPI003F8D7A89
MNPRSLRFVPTAVLAMSFALPLAAAAEDEKYRDAAQVQAELVKVLTCQASRAEFERLGSALTPVYYEKPAQPALAGWSLVKDEKNAFVAVFNLPKPVTVYGHTTQQVMMPAQALLAVLDGDHVDALSTKLKLAPSTEPLAKHIRTRTVRVQPIGDGIEATIVQTVSTITTHPGKTMVGCEYRMNY